MAEDDIRDTVDQQIEELRSQLKHINKTLSDHGIDLDEIKKDAENALQGAAHAVQDVARYAQDEAATVIDTARRAPAGTTTVLALAGGLGFLAGYLVAMNAETSHHRRWRW